MVIIGLQYGYNRVAIGLSKGALQQWGHVTFLTLRNDI